jgi:hypothetical protein
MNRMNNVLSLSPSKIISIIAVILIATTAATVTVTVTANATATNNRNGEGDNNNNNKVNTNNNEWKLHMLNADTYPMAKCLDGSQGAYYVREGNEMDSSKVFFFLEGGGWCDLDLHPYI